MQIVYAEKLHILIYVKFPHRQLLLPDGALILPVIPDRIILVKDNKTAAYPRAVRNANDGAESRPP